MNKVKLFGVVFLIGLVLAIFSDTYMIFLHEFNHAIAALITGNIPMKMELSPGAGVLYYLPVTARFSQAVRDFVSVSGAGLAIAIPGIIYLFLSRPGLSWISGFFIPGIPRGVSYWGHGHDFVGINSSVWIIVMSLFTMAVYALVCYVMGVQYERYIRKAAALNHRPPTRPKLQCNGGSLKRS